MPNPVPCEATDEYKAAFAANPTLVVRRGLPRLPEDEQGRTRRGKRPSTGGSVQKRKRAKRGGGEAEAEGGDNSKGEGESGGNGNEDVEGGDESEGGEGEGGDEGGQ
ncbi:uncharacterized protein SCHCODRAFT_02705294 [Schizophyllum commune H4-8]|nr:uncharacterized protein SCHCODRAFT_02671929 [Schizophyllum commune H4-8]XP_050198292.1 uncharacterized protein SCHCODRAFT_02705294 [Schizophyllum commune H4-8]KAI5888004.1 hypothetical protein SCHCODRAFT_02705294 [Schizophyllum commune H4-8]KAI5888014.1 hypothetical protein SCHCODRAFT_02671929 [Schizophyllum commune H4-8]